MYASADQRIICRTGSALQVDSRASCESGGLRLGCTSRYRHIKRRRFVRHTVIALFDTGEAAQSASAAVRARGFDEFAVHLILGGETADSEVIAPAVTIEGGPLTGLLHRLSLLLGVEEPHLAHYEEAIRRGGHVVQVDAADETKAATARDTLLANGAVNIEDRVEEWKRAGWRGPGVAAPAAGSTSSVVHRREVSIQGVRVYGHVDVVPFEDLVEDFRSDYQAQYATRGLTYEDFDPAYRYGHALASDPRFDGGDWDEIETDARAEWARRYPQDGWEGFKSAVRQAWARATRR